MTVGGISQDLPDGDDSHLRVDQKPLGHAVAGVDDDDPRKIEKLTKAGRDIDPDAGSD